MSRSRSQILNKLKLSQFSYHPIFLQTSQPVPLAGLIRGCKQAVHLQRIFKSKLGRLAIPLHGLNLLGPRQEDHRHKK